MDGDQSVLKSEVQSRVMDRFNSITDIVFGRIVAKYIHCFLKVTTGDPNDSAFQVLLNN